MDAYAEGSKNHDEHKQLYASLGLLPVDAGQVKYLCGRLLNTEPEEVIVITKLLAQYGHREQVLGTSWQVLEDTKRDSNQRFLAEYAAERAEFLADVLMDGDAKEFGILFPKLAVLADAAKKTLNGELAKPLGSVTAETAKEQLAKRQANAAVALLRFGQAQRV